MGKYNDIPAGTFFKAGGRTFRKIDDLYYVDPSEPDMERMINPMFESTIGEKIAEFKEGQGFDVTAKFLIDPVTRIVKPNPHYDPSVETARKALEAFSKLWQSGLFKCESNDFDFIVNECLLSVSSLRSQQKTASAPAKTVAKKATTVGKKATAKKMKKAPAKKAPKKGRR